MSDIEVHVRSNVDRLSERAIHDAFYHLLKDITEEGTDMMRIIAPRGETSLLSASVSHIGPEDVPEHMEARIGIPPIPKPSLSTGVAYPNSALYPKDVDEGTGIYGDHSTVIYPKSGYFMKLPPKGDYNIYQPMVRGQEGQHYVAKTYAAIRAALDTNVEYFKQELKARLAAGALT